MSYLNLLENPRFFDTIATIDSELAMQCKQSGCPHCNGPLHDASYTRKPRGEGCVIPDEHKKRHSFCCGREGCRKRTMPPSLIFWGRKVYFGCALLLLTGAAQSLTSSTLKELCDSFGVSRRTIKRWLIYFRFVFPRSTAWQKMRGVVSAAILNHTLPLSLLHHYFSDTATPKEALIQCLCLMTGISCHLSIQGSSSPKNFHAKDAQVTEMSP